jgi:hypothetical protein
MDQQTEHLIQILTEFLPMIYDMVKETHNIKLITLSIFKYTFQWYKVHSFYYTTTITIHLQNCFIPQT